MMRSVLFLRPVSGDPTNGQAVFRGGTGPPKGGPDAGVRERRTAPLDGWQRPDARDRTLGVPGGVPGVGRRPWRAANRRAGRGRVRGHRGGGRRRVPLRSRNCRAGRRRTAALQHLRPPESGRRASIRGGTLVTPRLDGRDNEFFHAGSTQRGASGRHRPALKGLLSLANGDTVLAAAWPSAPNGP